MAFSFVRFLLVALAVGVMLPSTGLAAIDQDFPSVKLQTLDKATARTNTVIVKVGDTVEFGSLFIKVQSCRESGALDQPESAAFLQIWEVPINAEKSEWIFSGWMFASSPALSAMDHPVYDVWVLDCAGGEEKPAPENNVTVRIDGVEVTDDRPPESPSVEGSEELDETSNSLETTIDKVLEEVATPDTVIPTDPIIVE